GYTERLTGFVLAPIAQLTQRAVSTLPVLIVALTAALAVWALVRFVGLFFCRGRAPRDDLELAAARSRPADKLPAARRHRRGGRRLRGASANRRARRRLRPVGQLHPLRAGAGKRTAVGQRAGRHASALWAPPSTGPVRRARWHGGPRHGAQSVRAA